jgi:hypothetical protein
VRVCAVRGEAPTAPLNFHSSDLRISATNPGKLCCQRHSSMDGETLAARDCGQPHGRAGRRKGDYKAAAAKGGSQRAEKAAAQAAQRAVQPPLTKQNAAKAIRDAPANAANDSPGAQPARNVSSPPFTCCGTTPAWARSARCLSSTTATSRPMRAKLIDDIKLEVEAETAKKKAVQVGVAQRYREHNSDQQRLYVCATRRTRKSTPGSS